MAQIALLQTDRTCECTAELLKWRRGGGRYCMVLVVDPPPQFVRSLSGGLWPHNTFPVGVWPKAAPQGLRRDSRKCGHVCCDSCSVTRNGPGAIVAR